MSGSVLRGGLRPGGDVLEAAEQTGLGPFPLFGDGRLGEEPHLLGPDNVHAPPRDVLLDVEQNGVQILPARARIRDRFGPDGPRHLLDGEETETAELRELRRHRRLVEIGRPPEIRLRAALPVRHLRPCAKKLLRQVALTRRADQGAKRRQIGFSLSIPALKCRVFREF